MNLCLINSPPFMPAGQDTESKLEKTLAELQRRVGRALGVRDCDKVGGSLIRPQLSSERTRPFHGKPTKQNRNPPLHLQVLNDAVEQLKGEIRQLDARLNAAQAGLLAGEGVASQGQLQELLALMRGKASKEDMRAVLARSVELALDAYRRAAGDLVGSGATRFRWAVRCCVCACQAMCCMGWLRDSSTHAPESSDKMPPLFATPNKKMPCVRPGAAGANARQRPAPEHRRRRGARRLIRRPRRLLGLATSFGAAAAARRVLPDILFGACRRGRGSGSGGPGRLQSPVTRAGPAAVGFPWGVGRGSAGPTAAGNRWRQQGG